MAVGHAQFSVISRRAENLCRTPAWKRRSRRQVHAWELILIDQVARRFSTTERDDLQAELARKLLMLKSLGHAHARDWNAYVTKFLYNKAANWVRDLRARGIRKVHFVESRMWVGGKETSCAGASPLGPERDLDLRIDFA